MAELALPRSTDALNILQLMRCGPDAPLLLVAVLAMILLPLPPLALDVLFTFNIALSVLVAMAVVNVSRPLDFAIVPTALLLATLSRPARAPQLIARATELARLSANHADDDLRARRYGGRINAAA